MNDEQLVGSILAKDVMSYMNFTASKLNDMLLHIDAQTKIQRYDEWVNIIQSKAYSDRLCKHGFKVYSQEDQDGILQYLCEQLKIEKGIFAEFGAGEGETNSTHYLLLKGFKGCWIECNEEHIKKIKAHYIEKENKNSKNRLMIIHSMITPENINQLLNLYLEKIQEKEFDILVCDTDWHDYYLFEALELKPKIIVIEYNASIPRDISLVVPKDEPYGWRGDNYFGASFKALYSVGRKKGYTLIGCNSSGIDMFFVRNDLIDKFSSNSYLGDVKLYKYDQWKYLYEYPQYELCFSKGHESKLENFLNLENQNDN